MSQASASAVWLGENATTGESFSVITADRLSDRGPDLTATPDGYVLVWSHAPPSPDAGREIRVADGRDGEWVGSGAVTDGDAHDSQPAVAHDPETGRTVAVWTRTETAGLDDDATAAAAINATEIYYAVREDGRWSAPRALTDDDRMDVSPRVVAHDGAFTVVWSSVRGTAADGSFVVEHVGLDADGPGEVRSRAVSRVPVRVAAGDRVRVAYVDGEDGSVVTLVREDGRLREIARYDATDVRSLSVGPEGVAWVGADGDDRQVFYGTDGRTERIPSRLNVSAVGGVRLAWGDGFPMVAYRAAPEGDPARRLVYATRQGGEWVVENAVSDTAGRELSFFETTVAAGESGFVAAFTGRERATPEQNRDVFAVTHEFRPDLTVAASTVEDDGDGDSDRVRVDVTLSNRGERAVEDVRVAVHGAGDAVTTRQVAALAPGESHELTVRVAPPSTGAVRVVADPAGRVAELSETNNATRAVTARPDAAVTAVDTRVSPGGDGAAVTATVTNGGSAVATGVTVALTDDRGTVDARQVGRLAPGETRTLTLSVGLDRLNASGTTVTVDAREDADAINDSLLVRGPRPDLQVLAPDVEFAAAGDSVLATVRVSNLGDGRGTFPVRVRHEGEVVATARATLPRGVPDGVSTQVAVRLPARLSGEQVTVVADAPADRSRQDNAVTVTVPSLAGVDDDPPTVDNFTATAEDGTVVVRFQTDERLDPDATTVVVDGPNDRHVVSGDDLVRRGPGFTYIARVDAGAAGTYEATLRAAADGAGNPLDATPSAVTSVADGGMGTMPMLAGALALFGLGAAVAYRRVLA